MEDSNNNSIWGKPLPKGWKCPSCMTNNDLSYTHCQCCQEPNPNSDNGSSVGKAPPAATENPVFEARAPSNRSGDFQHSEPPPAGSSQVLKNHSPQKTGTTLVEKTPPPPRRSTRIAKQHANDLVVGHTGDDMSNQSGHEKTNGTDENHTFTVVNKFGSRVQDVAAGAYASAVLLHNGRVVFVGDPSTGGREGVPDNKKHRKRSLQLDPKIKVQSIIAGDTFFLSLTIDGELFFCGHFHDSDTGKKLKFPRDDLEVEGIHFIPVKVPHSNGCKWKSIAAGEKAAAAIDENGKVFSFGLEHPHTLARSIQDRGDQSDLKDIIGEMYKTGEMWKHRYHRNTVSELLTPAPMCFADPSRGLLVKGIAVGAFHMLVVATKKSSTATSVYACGRSDCGQLGLGDTSERDFLTKIGFSDGTDIQKVAAGTHHSMALDKLGHVWVWGRNDDGQAGCPSNKEHVLEPRRLDFPEGVEIVDVSAKGHVSMAITKNGELYSWGAGPTGHASDDPITSPTIVPLKDKHKYEYSVIKVAPGVSHSLFITKRA